MLNQLFYNRFIELKFLDTTHLSMQHCFHVGFFYIIGIQYLHVRHPGKNMSFRTCI